MWRQFSVGKRLKRTSTCVAARFEGLGIVESRRHHAPTYLTKAKIEVLAFRLDLKAARLLISKEPFGRMGLGGANTFRAAPGRGL
jgi:hypothetical protein